AWTSCTSSRSAPTRICSSANGLQTSWGASEGVRYSSRCPPSSAGGERERCERGDASGHQRAMRVQPPLRAARGCLLVEDAVGGGVAGRRREEVVVALRGVDRDVGLLALLVG